MSSIAVLCVQYDIKWEDMSGNLIRIEHWIEKNTLPVNVIILPEMFTTGFTMSAFEMAEEMDGPTVAWMHTISAKYKSAVCGSIIIKDGKQYFNRFIWVDESGRMLHYDKRHLFSYAGEDKYFDAGKHKLIFEYKGWKICPLICYDLRFPVWSRNTQNYDLLIYSANWPSARANAWKDLLIARAIENQCYTIGVNRVGIDASDRHYQGDSSIIDYSGKRLQLVSNDAAILWAELEKEEMIEFRKELNFLPDQDRFEILL